MELMVTVAVAAAIFGIGVPAFSDFGKNGRLTGAANETLLTFMTARKEGTLLFAQQQGRASARKEDNRDAGYATVPNWPVIVKMVEEAAAVQFTPVEQDIATAIGTAVTNVQQKKQSPKEALDGALQTGQAALDQYWSTRKR